MDARTRLDSMYRAHHPAIWRTVRRLGFPPEQAADATAQAYLVAAERLGDIIPGCERAFLFSTAIRVAKSLGRASRRAELRADPEHPDDARARPAPDAVSERLAAQSFVEQLFAKMDPHLVEVFVLYELEGFSSPEIAETLGLPLGTVASRLRRARETFRAAALALESSHFQNDSSSVRSSEPGEFR